MSPFLTSGRSTSRTLISCRLISHNFWGFRKFAVLFLCCVNFTSFFQQYKFVDSQSLLPDPGGWTAAGTTGLDDDDDDDDDDFTMTSLSKLTSAPATHRKAKDGPSSAGGVSTPKRSRMLGGATGSAKRKQTPKPKKSKSCSYFL